MTLATCMVVVLSLFAATSVADAIPCNSSVTVTRGGPHTLTNCSARFPSMNVTLVQDETSVVIQNCSLGQVTIRGRDQAIRVLGCRIEPPMVAWCNAGRSSSCTSAVMVTVLAAGNVSLEFSDCQFMRRSVDFIQQEGIPPPVWNGGISIASTQPTANVGLAIHLSSIVVQRTEALRTAFVLIGLSQGCSNLNVCVTDTTITIEEAPLPKNESLKVSPSFVALRRAAQLFNDVVLFLKNISGTMKTSRYGEFSVILVDAGFSVAPSFRDLSVCVTDSSVALLADVDTTQFSQWANDLNTQLVAISTTQRNATVVRANVTLHRLNVTSIATQKAMGLYVEVITISSTIQIVDVKLNLTVAGFAAPGLLIRQSMALEMRGMSQQSLVLLSRVSLSTSLTCGQSPTFPQDHLGGGFEQCAARLAYFVSSAECSISILDSSQQNEMGGLLHTANGQLRRLGISHNTVYFNDQSNLTSLRLNVLGVRMGITTSVSGSITIAGLLLSFVVVQLSSTVCTNPVINVADTYVGVSLLALPGVGSFFSFVAFVVVLLPLTASTFNATMVAIRSTVLDASNVSWSLHHYSNVAHTLVVGWVQLPTYASNMSIDVAGGDVRFKPDLLPSGVFVVGSAASIIDGMRATVKSLSSKRHGLAVIAFFPMQGNATFSGLHIANAALDVSNISFVFPASIAKGVLFRGGQLALADVQIAGVGASLLDRGAAAAVQGPFNVRVRSCDFSDILLGDPLRPLRLESIGFPRAVISVSADNRIAPATCAVPGMSPTHSLTYSHQADVAASPVSMTAAAISQVAVGAAAGTIAIAAGSAVLLEMQSLGVLASMRCAPGALKSSGGVARYMVSPFYDLGWFWVVAGNITVSLTVAVAHVCVILWRYARRAPLSFATSLSTVALESGFPRYTHVACVFLIQGVLRGGVTLLLDGSAETGVPSSSLVGFIGILWGSGWVVLPTALRRYWDSNFRYEHYHMRMFPAWIQASSSRRSLMPDGRWGSNLLRGALGSFMGTVTERRRGWGHMNLILASCVAAWAAMPFPQTTLGCSTQWGVLVVMCCGGGVVQYRVCPQRAPASNAFLCVSYAIHAAIAACAFAGLHVRGEENTAVGEAVIAALTFLQTGLAVTRALHQVLVKIVEKRISKLVKSKHTASGPRRTVADAPLSEVIVETLWAPFLVLDGDHTLEIDLLGAERSTREGPQKSQCEYPPPTNDAEIKRSLERVIRQCCQLALPQRHI